MPNLVDIKPSRKLDAMIHEAVFGAKHRDWFKKIRDVTPVEVLYWRAIDDVPHYSTEIADAFKVLEKLGNDYMLETDCDRNFVCSITNRPNWSLGNPHGVGKTAEHAICLAALTALKWKGPKNGRKSKSN